MKNQPGFPELIKNAFSIFSKASGQFIGFTLLLFGLSKVTELLDDHIFPVFNITYSILIAPGLFVGWFHASKEIQEYKSLAFGTFFSGFRRLGGLIALYLMQIALVILFTLIFVMILVLALDIPISEFAAGANDLPESIAQSFGYNWMLMILIILLMMPFLYLAGITFILTSIDYAMTQNTLGRSFKVGIQIVRENVGQLFLYLILSFLLALAGAIALIIGLLVVVPVLYITLYLFYQSRTEIPEESSDPYEDLLVN